MQLIDFFDKGVARYPERYVVVDGERCWTYREMALLIDQVATALIAQGVQAGDKVALCSPNHAMVLAAQYGSLRAGAIWVPINYRNTPAATLESLQAIEVQWLFFHSSQRELAQAVKLGLPGFKGQVCIDQSVPEATGLEQWVHGLVPCGQFPTRQSHDPVAILMSSGTTGAPKGILLSNLAFTSMVASFDVLLPITQPPVHLVVAPLTHAAGIYAMALFAHGGTQVLQQHTEAEAILQAIEAHAVTTVFLPPTLIYMLLAHPHVHQYRYDSLKSMLYGAAPMSVDKLREAMRIFGPVLAQGYGQSEALMAIAHLSAQDHAMALADPALEHRLKSAGREGPLVRVAIMDDEGRLLPDGQPGEIVVRGDIVMDGYYNNPQASREASAFGWHHTGDIGLRDKDGFIYVIDRKKEMIISGGFNIFPAEVEQALLGHPAVKDCAVVGVPDEKWGEAVLAAVELRPGHSFDAAELTQFCKDRLGSVKAPKQVVPIEALPRSAVGKVLRREVRAPYWAHLNRTI
ncbi:class I adenylate-forming enzyme family protein [Lampropedia aestuarii]|uniref:class I adenylate-forming enzyme family protein n=1 Tax=Lampropedia aestuarii TaxID=2562762 RepID=UPI0024690523|nr:AMP-binding protein [Lampropedia aestuarii]MDH5856478.1 AMP-binding protein [Lampropedia aestuarii]